MGSSGIVIFNTTSAIVPALTVTTVDGSNSNNTIQNNTIQNCHSGIVFIAFGDVSPFTLGDQNNLVTGNSILNYGGGIGSTTVSNGIFANHQWGLSITDNIINNNNGGGVNHPNTLRGIFLNISSTSASATVTGNTITIHGAGTTSQLAAIENSFGSTAAGNTINISNNTITGSYLTATSGVFYGIYNTATAANILINNNTISNINYGDIANTGTGAVYPIWNSGIATNVTIRENLVSNISRIGSSGGTTIGVFVSGGTNQTVKLNTIENMSIDGLGTTSTMFGIQTSTGTIIVDSNIVRNLTVLKTTGISLLYGLHNIAAPNNENYNFNQIYNLTHNGTGITYGMNFNTTTGTRTVSNNLIYNLSSFGTTIAGMSNASSSPNVFRNKIYGITSFSAAAPAVSGIIVSTVSTAGQANIFNNYIGELYAPNASTASATLPTIRGINIISFTTNSNFFIRYNTVRLDGTSSGANFGATAIFQSGNATATTANLTMQNNNFVNAAAPKGVGRSTIYFRSLATATNLNAATNNNNFYIPVTSASSPTYADPTNTYITLADYQAGIGGVIDAASVYANPSFLSTTVTDANYLHINPAVPTLLESNGVVVAGISNDYNGDIRFGAGGYTGTGTATDIGADEFEGIPLPTCAGTPLAGTISGNANNCEGLSTTLEITGATDAIGISYQWRESAIAGGPYTNVGSNSTVFATGVLSSNMYYVADVTCFNSGITVSTPEFAMIYNLNPIVAITSPNLDICVNGSTTLTANGADTYVWTPAATLSSSTGTTVTASPLTNTTYTVTGTVTATGCIASATASVSVFQNPIINAVTADPENICVNGTTQLNVSVTPPSIDNLTYSTGSGATLADMTGFTQILNPSNDDTPAAAIAIGFDFAFNGINYSNFSMSPDGFIWLTNGTAAAANQFTNSTASTTNIPKIAAYWDDVATGTTGYGRYNLIGTAPNRIAVMEWFVTIPRNTTGPANSTFQLLLYETTGKIEMRYGTMGTGAMSATIGLINNPSTFNEVNTNLTTNNTNSAVDNISAQPASGTFYSWESPTVTYAWTPSVTLNDASLSNPLASLVPSTTTFEVTVTNNAGCSSSEDITVNVGAPFSSEATVSPSNSACSGTNVTLSATPLGGGGPYTYAWTGPNTFTSDMASPVLTGVAVANTGTYNVTITDACGGTSTANVALTVNALPVVSVTPTSDTLCIGDAPIALAASGADTYAWSPSNGLSASTGASVTANPTSTTIYTVTGTETATGCSASAITTITVGAPVAPSSLTANPSVVCEGGSTNLNMLVSGGGNTYSVAQTTGATYSQLSGDGVTIINQNAQLTPGFGDVTQDDGGVIVNIPFSFTYMGNTFSQISLSTNGWISAGSALPITAAQSRINGNFFTATVPNNTMAVWFRDMGANFPLQDGSMRHGLIGTDVYTFQWDNAVGSGFSQSAVNKVSFQVNIHGPNSATPGRIEYIYGPTQGVTGFSTAIGIENGIGGAGNFLNAVNGSTTLTTLTSAWPGNGNGYVFDPINFNYSWSPSALLNDASVLNPIASGITETTTFTGTITTNLGCSASGTVTVNVTPNSFSSISASACVSYTAPDGAVYTASGIYTAVIPNAAGCDSTITIDLTIIPNTQVILNPVICQGTSYLSPAGNNYTVSGTYSEQVQPTQGCPVEFMINLTVNETSSSETTVTECDSYTWNGTTYTMSGTYTLEGLTNANGCDSTATLVLTINNSFESTQSFTACDSYEWSNGTVYTESGTYIQELQTGAGCDSTLTLVLTINASSTNEVEVTACDEFTWNDVTYTESGEYTQVFENAAGCDSTVTLMLTINNSSSSSVATEACGSYTWDVTGMTYTESGMYTATLENAAGCDSIITLDLTINNFSVLAINNGNATLTANAGVSFQWVTCPTFAPIAGETNQLFTAEQNGNYAVIATDENGCVDTSSCVSIVNVGLEGFEENSIAIYPNPTEDFVVIDFSAATATIEILDAQGKLIRTMTIVSGDQVSLKNEQSAVYFVRIITENATTVHRIVKQ